MTLGVLAVALMLLGGGQAETITAIEVHGNTLTPDAEIRTLSGLAAGAPFGPSTIADATARLEASKKFQRVEILKRFASISDPSQILLVVIVDEGAVHIEGGDDPDHPIRVVRDRNLKLMFIPILSYEDGYGLTYGAQFTRRNPAGADSRLSVPLTWGGDKRAAVEFDKILGSVAVGRLLAGAAISRRTLPFYGEDDDKTRAWARGERDVLSHLRLGATAALEHDSFVTLHDSFAQAGVDATYDTRIDPVLPRNAIYARAAWDHFAFRPGAESDYGANRIDLDARGYLGVFGQNILVLRAYKTDSDAPLPPYLKPELGGNANLRGFAAGTAVGDTLVSTSADLLVPLTSPLSIGKIGLSAFVDSATVYPKGSTLEDQTWLHGYGGGVWFAAAFLRLNVVVAHGHGATTRVHVGADLSF